MTERPFNPRNPRKGLPAVGEGEEAEVGEAAAVMVVEAVEEEAAGDMVAVEEAGTGMTAIKDAQRLLA